MNGPSEQLELLRSIDTKLAVLLAIVLDDYVRTHRIAGAHERPIDQMLIDSGLSTAEAATLLGKTQRAVQKQVGGTSRPAKKRVPKKRSRKLA